MAIIENKKKDIVPFAMAISLMLCFMRNCHSFRYFKTFQCSQILTDINQNDMKKIKANNNFEMNRAFQNQQYVRLGRQAQICNETADRLKLQVSQNSRHHTERQFSIWR